MLCCAGEAFSTGDRVIVCYVWRACIYFIYVYIRTGISFFTATLSSSLMCGHSTAFTDRYGKTHAGGRGTREVSQGAAISGRGDGAALCCTVATITSATSTSFATALTTLSISAVSFSDSSFSPCHTYCLRMYRMLTLIPACRHDAE